MKNIHYKNKETGFEGTLYGESSLVIKNEKIGYYMHTGSRNINTYDELKELVDSEPRFIKTINFRKFDKK
jgi:hypothetical protein